MWAICRSSSPADRSSASRLRGRSSGDPTLLLADEPTGDLDSHSATEILEILRRLNEDFKKTIVMVTHDSHAASYAHVTRHPEKGMRLPPELSPVSPQAYLGIL